MENTQQLDHYSDYFLTDAPIKYYHEITKVNNFDGRCAILRELEENNIRISCRTFVRLQGVIAGA